MQRLVVRKVFDSIISMHSKVSYWVKCLERNENRNMKKKEDYNIDLQFLTPALIDLICLDRSNNL